MKQCLCQLFEAKGYPVRYGLWESPILDDNTKNGFNDITGLKSNNSGLDKVAKRGAVYNFYMITRIIFIGSDFFGTYSLNFFIR
jgi:hypothetical protein